MGYIIILSTNYYNTMDKLKMKFSGSKYGEPLEFDIDSENDYVSLSGVFQVGSNLENSNLEGGAKSIYDYIIDPKTNKSHNIFSKEGKKIIKNYKLSLN